MTPAEALEEVRGRVRANRWRVTGHARRRMAERGASYDDVRHALLSANSSDPTDVRGRWLLAGGTDVSGDDLHCVVVIEFEVVVVTLF